MSKCWDRTLVQMDVGRGRGWVTSWRAHRLIPNYPSEKIWKSHVACMVLRIPRRPLVLSQNLFSHPMQIEKQERFPLAIYNDLGWRVLSYMNLSYCCWTNLPMDSILRALSKFESC